MQTAQLSGQINIWSMGLTFCLHQHVLHESSPLLSWRTATVSARGFMLHQGTVFSGSCASCRPLSSTRTSTPDPSTPKTAFTLSGLSCTSPCLADFPTSVWAWNQELSTSQYAAFKFPQVFSDFGNDLADGTECASLPYRKIYPRAGWQKLSSSNSSVLPLTFFPSAGQFLCPSPFLFCLFSLKRRQRQSWKVKKVSLLRGIPFSYSNTKQRSLLLKMWDTGGKEQV